MTKGDQEGDSMDFFFLNSEREREGWLGERIFLSCCYLSSGFFFSKSKSDIKHVGRELGTSKSF